MISPVIGKQYNVFHARKGNFTIRVTNITGSLITGVITKGTAHYISEDNRGPGDSITLDPNGPLCRILCESSESSNIS